MINLPFDAADQIRFLQNQINSLTLQLRELRKEVDALKAPASTITAAELPAYLNNKFAPVKGDKPNTLQVQPPKEPKLNLLKALTEDAPPPAPEMIIDEERQRALDLMNDPACRVLYIIGKAGSGKSMLLRYFRQRTDRLCMVVAPTGKAALNAGGETIHRAFKVPIHITPGEVNMPYKDTDRRRIENLEVLIIDEISMVRPDVLDYLDLFFRTVRNNQDLFGGVKVIGVGDPFQLPPVIRNEESQFFRDHYGTDQAFFFHAKVARKAALEGAAQIVNLQNVFRQNDPEFVEALNALQIGAMEQKHYKVLNRAYAPGYNAPTGETWLTLVGTNDKANQMNQRMIDSLPGEPRSFAADITGEFKAEDAPTDTVIVLKVNASVMFVKNDPDGEYQNGTLGRVTQLDPLLVETERGASIEVVTNEWESVEQVYDQKLRHMKRKVVGKFVQIPLRLAAAITIHKSQGMSLDRVIFDVNTTFASGMAYVLWSRARSLEGIRSRYPLTEKMISVSQEVKRWVSGQPIAQIVEVEQQKSIFSEGF